MHPAQRLPWPAWLLLGVLPVACLVGLVMGSTTGSLAALALMPLVVPVRLFYTIQAAHSAYDDADLPW